MNIEIQTTIINRLGLHARAATQLVNCASAFEAGVWLKLGDRQVNAKSIMGVLTLAATQGTEIGVVSDGEDAEAAAKAVVELIRNRFNEDE
jgi:phosphotransferase system HPr (HPr) family protein